MKIEINSPQPHLRVYPDEETGWTSERTSAEAYVWTWLPGQTEQWSPVV